MGSKKKCNTFVNTTQRQQTRGEQTGFQGEREQVRELRHTQKSATNKPRGYIAEFKEDPCIPVFTAALFTTVRTGKQPKCPSTEEWIKKMWSTDSGVRFRHKKKEIMPFAATWGDPEIPILSEVRQRKTNTI